MQIYFHSRLCSYLLRVPILVKGTVKCCMYIKRVHLKGSLDTKFPFPTSCLNINVCWKCVLEVCVHIHPIMIQILKKKIPSQIRLF